MSEVTLTVVKRSEPQFEKAEDVQEILKDNLPILRKVMIYLEAKPLHSLIAVALENFVNSRDGWFSASLVSRFNYVETGLISLVCLLYNFVMALGATLLAIATCGQFDIVNNVFNKHWLHTAVAACGIGISVLGFTSPLIGAVATGGMLSVIISRVRNSWDDLKLPSDEERVAIVKALYMQHRDDLVQGLEQLAADSSKVNKMIRRIDRAINEARSLEQLLKKCLQGIVRLPRAQN